MAPVVALTSAAAAVSSNVRLHSVSARAVVPTAPPAVSSMAPVQPRARAAPPTRAQHIGEADQLVLAPAVLPGTAWQPTPDDAPAVVVPPVSVPSPSVELGTAASDLTSTPASVDATHGGSCVASSYEPSMYAYSYYSYAPSQHHAYSSAASCHNHQLQKDQNSVTIKSDTSVKDAAGAIVKVLDRLCSTIVSSLQEDVGHEALNRACKALAVCRKYLTDSQPGLELSFLPVNRTNDWGHTDPGRFSFLAFKSRLEPGVQLATGTSTRTTATASSSSAALDLHVSSNADPGVVAAGIVRALVEEGQAVLKAGGGAALYVAMSGVVRARQQLKAEHAMDVLLVPQWVTEDTRAVLGRESKFLQFNLLPAGLHGVMEGLAHALRQPAVVPVAAPELCPASP